MKIEKPINILATIEKKCGLKQDFIGGRQEDVKISSKTIIFLKNKEFINSVKNVERKVGYKVFGNS